MTAGGSRAAWRVGAGIVAASLAAALLAAGCAPPAAAPRPSAEAGATAFDYATMVPAYGGRALAAVNGGEPFFDEADYARGDFEIYSGLDELGRVGQAFAMVGSATMPEPGARRGDISSVTPTGWAQRDYDWVGGGRLYNRCHLIGWQLAAEDANPLNLMTGTRTLNETMERLESRVRRHVDETGGHVLYRVSPHFEGAESVARGVLVEAASVETGELRMCVWCYNAERGVDIDYATGESEPDGTMEADDTDWTRFSYVLNLRGRKFHLPTCASVGQIAPENRQGSDATREELIGRGYEPCGSCRP